MDSKYVQYVKVKCGNLSAEAVFLLYCTVPQSDREHIKSSFLHQQVLVRQYLNANVEVPTNLIPQIFRLLLHLQWKR